MAKWAAHALVGGVMSVLQGGKFGHGFVSAGLTQALSGGISKIGGSPQSSGYFSAGNRALRIFAAAIFGGTASKISGGKFANGAVTGAFSRALNDEAHSFAQKRDTGWWAETKAFVKGVISYPKDVFRTAVTGGSVACEGSSTACAQSVENSRRIGRALYDYNNDPEVAKQVDLANKLATQQVMNDPVIQSQIAGRATVATIVGTGGVVGMGLNVMAITGGALRASEAGGTFVDASKLVQGALGVDLE